MPFAAKMAHETRLIADHLVAVPHGGQVTYRDLTQLIGIDIRGRRHVLIAARKLALDEASVVFDTVRGKGLKRLAAEEIPGIGTAARKRIRRSARRARTTISKAMSGFNDVSPAVRRQQLAETAVLSLTEAIARDPIARKLELRNDPMSVAAAAKLLINKLVGG